MEVQPRELYIITLHQSTLIFMTDQIKEITQNKIVFHSLLLEELVNTKIKEDSVVLLSSPYIKDQAIKYLPESCKLIIGRRNLNYSKLRELIAIPKGTDLLVVNDSWETTFETMELLKESGLHFNFIPYIPGESFPNHIEIAVTPGEPQLAPPSIKMVIDIGHRVLDISIFYEVLSYFNLPEITYSIYSSRYIKSILALYQELEEEIQKAKLLHEYLEEIIDHNEAGIIAIDDHNKISLLNPKALKLLELKNDFVGHSISTIEEQSPLFELIELDCTEQSFITVKDKDFIVQKKNILINEKKSGVLIMFHHVEEIEKIEHQYRLLVKNKIEKPLINFNNFYSASNQFSDIIMESKKLAKTNLPVFIIGETGTGKSSLAEAIHNDSLYSDRPLIFIQCDGHDQQLLEKELFGFEERNARENRIVYGVFELGYGGTICIEEISKCPLAIQNRLLQVIKNKQVIRKGGDTYIPVDFRLIVTNSDDLKSLVEKGKFNSELFYQISTFPIYLPPIRHKNENIIKLMDHFLKEGNSLGSPIHFTDETIQQLNSYSWKGNYTELKNVASYIKLLKQGEITPDDLPITISNFKKNNDENNLPPDHTIIDNAIRELESQGILHDCFIILSEFKEGKNLGKSYGRVALMEALKNNGFDYSEQQLRTRMDMLRKYGFLIIRSGRLGTTISELGERFLDKIKKKKG